MNIDRPIRELGEIDTGNLAHAILSQDENAWREQEHRQREYDVHKKTQSIVMMFTDGSGWPQIDVIRQPGWERLADAALPVMNEIIERAYPKGGTVIRAMAAKLLAKGVIKPHVDSHASFCQGHRIHVPITTNPRVSFIIDGRPYKMKVGRAYEINNQLKHSVANKGEEDRITFIFDYVPPQAIKAVTWSA